MRLFYYRRFLLILLLISFSAMGMEANAKEMRIVFFSPTSENNTYWPQVFKVLRSVAENLDIDIQTYEFDVGDRFAKSEEGVRILKETPKPDGAVFSVAFGQTKPLLEAAKALDIPVFIQGPLFPSELPDLGGAPRIKYKNWIGYFYQDESEKGYLLGKTLLKAAHGANAYAGDGNIHAVGIGGDHTWFGSLLRKEGLIRAVMEDPGTRLHQVVPTKWTPSEGKTKTRLLLERYPEVSVVWAASDQLGIGAAQALEDYGKILGNTGFVGGLDLSENGLHEVKKNRMAATVSSSLFSYAEIMVYLHDYLHGIDFADDVGTKIDFKIYTCTKTNVDFHLSLLQLHDAVDFRQLSKVYNKDLLRYNFSLECIARSANLGSDPNIIDKEPGKFFDHKDH